MALGEIARFTTMGAKRRAKMLSLFLIGSWMIQMVPPFSEPSLLNLFHSVKQAHLPTP